MQTTERWEAVLSKAQEESAKRRGIRIRWQSSQVVKHPIAAQQLGRLDPSEPQDDRIEEGQERFRAAVAVVSLGQPDRMGQSGAQADPLN
mgnify:CR=1 FL=1|jgi:hypothetical protein